jgi:uncharacterized protein involved in exopolysaccharide biosynthesis
MQRTTAIVPTGIAATAIAPVSDLSLRTAVEGFFRQKWLFFSVVAAVLLATLVVTLVMRKQYLSEMEFLVQNTRENVVVTPEPTTSPSIISEVTEDQVNSELEILHSHDVIDPVADPGWSNLSPSQKTPDVIRHHENLIAKFEKKLDTQVVRKTNIITVSFLADSPEAAKDVLERLSASYLAELRRLQRPTGASEFFASEAERSRQAWDDATKELVDFQEQHQVVSLPDQETTLNTQITEDGEDLFATDSALRELDAQLAASSRKLDSMPSRQVSQQTVLPNQGLTEQLGTLIVQMENKRTDLATNYKPTDRLVQDLDRQIETAKAALNQAQAAPSKEETTDVDPAWQQLHTNYVQNEIARHATAEHEARLASRLSDLKEQLASLETVTAQFNNLQTRAEELKENYQLYAQKRDQGQIEDAMDEHKLLNVAVAQQPTVSYEAERPKPLIYGALGFVTAMFLGLCAVYFAETSRSTIATPRELDVASRYPVLATVPQMSWRSGRTWQVGLLGPDSTPSEVAAAGEGRGIGL